MQNMQNLLFDLSDNGNPITDGNGNVISSIDDVIDQCYELSPTLANIVAMVYKQQQKQIEELQREVDQLQSDYDVQVDGYHAEVQVLKDTCMYIAKVDIATLQVDLEGEQYQEGYIDLEQLQEKLQDIYSCLVGLANS